MIWVLLIYVLSVISARQVVKLLFIYDWKILKPDITDILIVFIPGLNTFLGTFGWLLIEFLKRNNDLRTRFFNLKDRE